MIKYQVCVFEISCFILILYMKVSNQTYTAAKWHRNYFWGVAIHV